MYQQTNPIYQNSKAVRDMVLLLMTYNGTHKVLKKITVICLLPNEQFDFVNENNMKLR